MSGCEYLLFVCRCCLRGVRRFSYWFDNLGLITEGNTYRCYTASSLPLWGNTDVVLADITSEPEIENPPDSDNDVSISDTETQSGNEYSPSDNDKDGDDVHEDTLPV